MTRTREEVEEVEGLNNEVEAYLAEIDDLDALVETRDAKLIDVETWLNAHKENLPKLAAQQLERVLLGVSHLVPSK